MATEKEENGKEKKTYFKSLMVDYNKYRTLLPEKYKNRKPWARRDEKKIRAFIPGTVRKVFVKKGKRVKQGDKLLVLEAMKMKNELVAPLDATVKQVNVKEGERVSKDKILVELG